ncbi:MAG: SOS response-associated peptidase family protein [Terriglobus roseus]|nr:SOS response-associated peptidase family protein [Terriglobus roseus]
MCGRYVLAQRPAEVRQRLQESNMPSYEAPDDDEVRQSYNFAPGYHGLVYRADTPDTGAGSYRNKTAHEDGDAPDAADEQDEGDKKQAEEELDTDLSLGERAARYKLQAMKWGMDETTGSPLC